MYTVTDAREPLSKNIQHRKRQYLVSMGARTLCLILAIVVPMPLPLRIIVLAAAIALPYFAVVVANAGRERARGADFASPEPGEREPRRVGSHHREIGS